MEFCPFEKMEYRSGIPISSDRYFWGIFFCKSLIKISKFRSKTQNLIQICDFGTQINFRFWPCLTPPYLKTSHGEGTSFSYRAVEKKSGTLLIFFRVRFDFVLTEFWPFEKKEYRSEHLVGIPGNFFLRFFDFPKTSKKQSNGAPEGPNASFYNFFVLLKKVKNFSIGAPWGPYCKNFWFLINQNFSLSNTLIN